MSGESGLGLILSDPEGRRWVAVILGLLGLALVVSIIVGALTPTTPVDRCAQLGGTRPTPTTCVVPIPEEPS